MISKKNNLPDMTVCGTVLPPRASSKTAFCGTTQYNWFVNDGILWNHAVQLVHQPRYLAEL